jgi:hypothetical protein
MTVVQPIQKTSDVDNRIETVAKLLAYGHGVDLKIHKRMAREWFLPGHGEYYLQYIVYRSRDIKRIVVSPHYAVIEIKSRASDAYNKYYVIGVDYNADLLFTNRINYVDMFNFYATKIQHVNNVTIIYTHDDAIKRDVFNYNYDVTEPQFLIDRTGRYRVQGDIVFAVSELDLESQMPAWAMHEIHRYLRYLVLDTIAALLNDYGISYDVREVRLSGRNTRLGLVVAGGSDSSRRSEYSARNRMRIINIFSDYFDVKCRNWSWFNECTLRLTIDKIPITANIEIMSDSVFGSHVGNIAIFVTEAGNFEVVNLFARDIIEQFHVLQKTNVVRQIGNHRIELYRVVPVRFAYEPRVKPLVLEPQTLYVVLNDTYIVDSDTLVELIHKEHGQRRLQFRGKYVLRIERVSVHPLDTAERNRITLRRIAPHKAQHNAN